jgi:hypothetical protein
MIENPLKFLGSFGAWSGCQACLPADIRDARLRRRLSTTLAAQRALLIMRPLGKSRGGRGVSKSGASLRLVLGLTHIG